MTPTISRNSFRSSGPRARNASSISCSVYSEALKRAGGPSPVANQCARTFNRRASSIKWTADKCGSLSFIHRLTTCGVAGSFFAKDIAFNPAASIEARSRAPKGIIFSPLRFFRTASPFRQVKKVSPVRPHGASSPLMRLPRHSFAHKRAGGSLFRIHVKNFRLKPCANESKFS